MKQIGISLYASSGLEKNLKMIEKAKEVGATFAFTSLHIPEENYTEIKQEILQMLLACQRAGIKVFVDISKETLEMLEIEHISKLKDFGIGALRFDDGFTPEEIVDCEQDFEIVVNASTFTEKDYQKYRELGVDFNRWIGCHNYYPKRYTGLSREFVLETNQRLHQYGMQTIGFIPGDEPRGPLYEKLPMVEEHRDQDFLKNLLDAHALQNDIIVISDIDITDDHYKELKDYQQGLVRFKVEIDAEYECFLNMLHHDRFDQSAYLIRSIESRTKVKCKGIQPKNTNTRYKGTLCLSNQNYLRYEGELEIAKCDLPSDPRVNCIGKVCNTGGGR